MSLERVKLWDLPTRLFHWLLVILIIAAVITAKIGGNAMNWHGGIGVSILGLLAFRLVWGFIGSDHARFASFWPRLSSVSAYLQGTWRGIGHNPLGAFSVLALLALIGLQVVTGLFSNDDIAFNGPLSSLVNKELSDKLTGIHKVSINVLMALIVLHLAAIAFYAFVKKENLVKPMITGWTEVESSGETTATTLKRHGVLNFVIALLVALATIYCGSGAWLSSIPPSAPAPTPAAQVW